MRRCLNCHPRSARNEKELSAAAGDCHLAHGMAGLWRLRRSRSPLRRHGQRRAPAVYAAGICRLRAGVSGHRLNQHLETCSPQPANALARRAPRLAAVAGCPGALRGSLLALPLFEIQRGLLRHLRTAADLHGGHHHHGMAGKRQASAALYLAGNAGSDHRFRQPLHAALRAARCRRCSLGTGMVRGQPVVDLLDLVRRIPLPARFNATHLRLYR